MGRKPKTNRRFSPCLTLFVSGLNSLPDTSIKQRYLSSEAECIFCILTLIQLKICCIRKRIEAQNIQSWAPAVLLAGFNASVCLFVKLNQAADEAHFNSTELVISTSRTTFLHFLLYATCANNVIVCHGLALQQIVLFCSYVAFILASKWKWYSNAFLRHLL